MTLALMSDLHFREEPPRCIDSEEFQMGQFQKMQEAIAQINTFHCDYLLISGDIFHKWKSEPWVISEAISTFKKSNAAIIVTPGQHDLPMHNQRLYAKSSLRALEEAGVVTTLLRNAMYRTPSYVFYGEGFAEGHNRKLPSLLIEKKKGRTNVLLSHRMVWNTIPPFPSCKGVSAKQMIAMYASDFDLIVTGDNHEYFAVSEGGVLLVNPGSLYRSSISQKDYKCTVYLWNEEWEEQYVIPTFPFEENLVRVKHTTKEKADVFIRTLEKDVEIGDTFKRSLQRQMDSRKAKRKTREIVKEVTDEK